MDDLEKALSPQVINASTRSGSELVIPFEEAKEAVHLAGRNSIAVLGVEAFRFMGAGLGVETYSGYEFEARQHSWLEFVRINNDAALRFIEEHALGKGYGYILTAASETELQRLPDEID